MTVTQFSFSEALAQLSDIGRQLREVADPDDVQALEAEADALVEHCRALLRQPRRLRANTAPRMPEPVFQPAAAADGAVITGSPGEAAPLDISTGAVALEGDEAGQPPQTVVLPPDRARSQQL